MKAIEIREPGDADVLVPTEVPDPAAGAGQVVIEVVAAGVNRADVMQRLGHYPPPAGASPRPGAIEVMRSSVTTTVPSSAVPVEDRDATACAADDRSNT